MKRLIILLFSLLVISAAKFPSKIAMEYAPEEGSVSKYELKVKSTLTLNNQNLKAFKISLPSYINHLTFVFSNSVDKINKDGSITETITYEDFIMEQEILRIRTPMDMEFDLKGKSFTTTVSKDGTVTGTSGFDVLAPTLRDLKLDNLFLQTRPVFPEKEIKIGDTWNNETSSRLPIGISIVNTVLKTTYTLSGFEKHKGYNCAVIKIELSTLTETIPVQQNEENFVVEVNLSGTGEGNIYYDYKKCRVVSSSITMALDSNIKSSAPTGISNLDTSQTVKMDLNLLKEVGKKK